MAKMRSTQRRQDILEALARMLQDYQGEHITTASLAQAVGVSEAALYRHFPSKTKMFEALVEFIEESVFTRINRILTQERRAAGRLQQLMLLLLGFAEKNPGMATLLHGGALVGETAQLRRRVAQIYDRLETQIRQILREGEVEGTLLTPVNETAGLFLALIEGRIARFVRSEFRDSPLLEWPAQWERLSRVTFNAPALVGGGRAEV